MLGSRVIASYMLTWIAILEDCVAKRVIAMECHCSLFRTVRSELVHEVLLLYLVHVLSSALER